MARRVVALVLLALALVPAVALAQVLFAGGTFPAAGGGAVPARVAQLPENAGTWAAMASGITAATTRYVQAMVEWNNTVVVGGYFTSAGSVAVKNVASWNGASWAPLGPGVSSVVHALVVWDDPNTGTETVVAAGSFTALPSSSTAAQNIARWTSTGWLPLLQDTSGSSQAGGCGVNGEIYAVVVSLGSIYAAGLFTLAGGVAVNNTAVWTGSAWSAMGTGTSGTFGGTVYALAVYQGNIVAGGDFNAAGGVAAPAIASWDGSAWSDLGGGVSEFVYALAVMGTNLYVGGFLSTAGSIEAYGVARWDGSAWYALGDGLGAAVSALQPYGSLLVAGGSFTSPSAGVAAWNGAEWVAVGNGLASTVEALCVADVQGSSAPNALRPLHAYYVLALVIAVVASLPL